MADADPLGVDMNVSFDSIGGLDDRQYPHSAFTRGDELKNVLRY